MSEALDQEIRTLRARFWSARDPEGRAFAPLADAYRRKGELEEAASLVEDGLARLPDFTPGHLVAARILRERGRLEEAGSAFDRLLDLDAENILALLERAELARETGDRDGAAEALRRLLALDPRHMGARAALDRLEASGPDAEAGPAEGEIAASPGEGDPEPAADPSGGPDWLEEGEEQGFFTADELVDPTEAFLGEGAGGTGAEAGSEPTTPGEEGFEWPGEGIEPGDGDGADLLAGEPDPAEDDGPAPLADAPGPADDPGTDFLADDLDPTDHEEPGILADDLDLEEDGDEELHVFDFGLPFQEGDGKTDASPEPSAAADEPGPLPAPDEGAEDDRGEPLTRTMAEIFARQGLFRRAIEVYERLSLADPDDEELATRLEGLRSEAADAEGERQAPGEGPHDGSAPDALRPIRSHFEDLLAWVPGAVPVENLAPDAPPEDAPAGSALAIRLAGGSTPVGEPEPPEPEEPSAAEAAEAAPAGAGDRETDDAQPEGGIRSEAETGEPEDPDEQDDEDDLDDFNSWLESLTS